jgi:hypothetical protein
MGGSDNGDAHTSIDIAANFAAGFLPLLSEHRGDNDVSHYFLLSSYTRKFSAEHYVQFFRAPPLQVSDNVVGHT